MKRFLLTLIDPPWWFLIFGWPVMVGLAIYSAIPSTMQQFLDAAPDPKMQLAIAREVRGAEQRVALEFASSVLRRIARYIPDQEGRQDIDKALADIKSEMDQGYRPRKPSEQPPADKGAADKSSAEDKSAAVGKAASAGKGTPAKTAPDDKPVQADKPASPEKSASAEGSDKTSKRERRRRARAAREADDASQDGYGIEINSKHGIHTNMRLLDQSTVTALEAKYGNETLPALDMEYKLRIYSEVQDRAHQFVNCMLIIIVLIVSWPLFFLSKIVMAIIRMFSSRTEQAKKVAVASSLERQLSEARLAAMQAQIEPHFLFNTMASVQQLIETDPPAAAKMQANLIKYLRGAVPQMRESNSTLGREFDLSSAYLDILKIRMEDRLSYVIDLPPALVTVAFPPMMLPTLVENAIKHGLEPRTEGGEVRIIASQGGGKLRVTVADTGTGFSNQPGKGVGLTNIRERLVAMYGKQAQLIIEANQPRGVRMTIEIPFTGAR